MIFRPDLARAVMRGAKSQTRRPVKPGEQRCRFHPGGSYAVQPGRGEPAIGRIVVTRVTRERLVELTPADADAEGFATVAEFARTWLDLYDPSYRGALDHATDDEALDRWRTRFAGVDVWAITFVPDLAARPRLLHRHSERGYTDVAADALPDEPEAVEPWFQERITRDAHERAAAARQAELDELGARDLADRIDRLERAANLSGVDVSREVRALRRRLDDVRRKATRPPAPRTGDYTPLGTYRHDDAPRCSRCGAHLPDCLCAADARRRSEVA